MLCKSTSYKPNVMGLEQRSTSGVAVMKVVLTSARARLLCSLRRRAFAAAITHEGPSLAGAGGVLSGTPTWSPFRVRKATMDPHSVRACLDALRSTTFDADVLVACSLSMVCPRDLELPMGSAKVTKRTNKRTNCTPRVKR